MSNLNEQQFGAHVVHFTDPESVEQIRKEGLSKNQGTRGVPGVFVSPPDSEDWATEVFNRREHRGVVDPYRIARLHIGVEEEPEWDKADTGFLEGKLFSDVAPSQIFDVDELDLRDSYGPAAERY